MKFSSALILLISLCFADNYIKNGDFEQDLTTGWFQSIVGTGVVIDRATTYDPDPDYEAYVYKYGTSTTGMGHGMLYQIVDVPTTNIDLSFEAKMAAWDNYIGVWAAAAVIVGYMDSDINLLGETKICSATDECPWANSSTQHIIPVTDNNWHSYNLNLGNELMYLPGVDPQQVKKIMLAMIDTMISC